MGFTHTGTLKDVLSGGYPKNEIMNMDLCDLEIFVSKLVQFTKLINSRTQGREANDRPNWWPTALDFHPNNGFKSRKVKASVLQKLIIKCSKYFRKYSYNYNWFRDILVNDENFFINGQCLKDHADSEVVLKKNAKSKCVLSKPIKVPVVQLDQVSEVSCDAPLTQAEHLSSFKLIPSSTKDKTVNEQKPFIGKIFKLFNSSHIPLSSDIGQMLIKRENHHIDEANVLRRLERTERYLNVTKNVHDEPLSFECHYSPSKRTRHYREYKFPKRQYHQYNVCRRLLTYCRPVKVVVPNTDLTKLKEDFELECRRNRKELVVHLERWCPTPEIKIEHLEDVST